LGRQEKRQAFRERLKSTLSNMSFPMMLSPDLGVQVIELMSGKAPVVWIQGQNCTGCTCALLDSDHLNTEDLAFDKISLRYQPDIMAAAGNVATASLADVWEERPGTYVLVVEGAIPTGEFAEFCTFGLGRGEKSLMGNPVPDEVPIADWIKELVPDAAAVVAVGNCASYGGLPMLISEVTGATPVPELVHRLDARKPVISGLPAASGLAGRHT
jgi:hydrogenase small subunit